MYTKVRDKKLFLRQHSKDGGEPTAKLIFSRQSSLDISSRFSFSGPTSKDKFDLVKSPLLIPPSEGKIKTSPRVSFVSQIIEDKPESKSRIPFMRQKSKDKVIEATRGLFSRQKSREKLNDSPKLTPPREKSKSIFDFAFSKPKETEKIKTEKFKNEKKNKVHPSKEIIPVYNEIVPKMNFFQIGVDMDELWRGLSIDCIKILALYWRVFGQEKKDLARYPFLLYVYTFSKLLWCFLCYYIASLTIFTFVNQN